MDLNEARSEAAELLREHGLESDEEDFSYVTEDLVNASEDASEEMDGEKETDDAGVEIFTINGHHLLYCWSRAYICYTPDCTNNPRRRVRTSRVFRIEHIGYCGYPTRKYKMFVR